MQEINFLEQKVKINKHHSPKTRREYRENNWLDVADFALTWGGQIKKEKGFYLITI